MYDLGAREEPTGDVITTGYVHLYRTNTNRSMCDFPCPLCSSSILSGRPVLLYLFKKSLQTSKLILIHNSRNEMPNEQNSCAKIYELSWLNDSIRSTDFELEAVCLHQALIALIVSNADNK